MNKEKIVNQYVNENQVLHNFYECGKHTITKVYTKKDINNIREKLIGDIKKYKKKIQDIKQQIRDLNKLKGEN